MAYTCWILANSALDSSAEKTVNMDSNEDKSPDLEKLQDARWKYLKQLLLTYLNIYSLRNRVIDLKAIVGYLLPDYLVLSEVKLEDSFPLAQFNLPNYEIWTRCNRGKNGGGLIEFVRRVLFVKN